jgi:4,5:9,10-diseco-3-hydroxy-5,9,17-trioxoandrosta-1(10),2-diene-4-oate hydrolase
VGPPSAAGSDRTDAAHTLKGGRVPEGRYADVGEGLRVHYQELGQGPVVLFLHGSGPGASGFSNFRRNYPYFAERGFRALVPDTVGYGYSSKPEGVAYSLEFLVGAVERFLDGLGVERCAVVGNSHGGAMTIALALRRPALVERIVLMAPGGLEVRETYVAMRGIRSMMKAVTAPGGITRDSLKRVLELQLFDPSRLTDDIINERMQIAESQPQSVLTSMSVPHLTPELEKIECPVFGLWGINDQFCPVSGAMRIAESCSDARVLLVGRCGHWVMVEHADLFNRLCLDFLREGARG